MKNKLNKDVFESVCAFLNRNGGHLLLGVEDKGVIIGIEPEAVEKLKKDFVTSMNNPQKISPTFYLSVEEVEIEEKIILYIFVPESSQVYRESHISLCRNFGFERRSCSKSKKNGC